MLHKYLATRFADTVVLTFAQIEDLSGLPLPEAAALTSEWWTAPAPNDHFADAWIKANRSARPNLSAKTVKFERI